MKKRLIILCMVLLGGSMMAQNVIGKPKYYKDSTQYTIGHGKGYEVQEGPTGMLTTKKSLLKHPFNVVFLETTSMIGDDLAFGLNLAVVPSVWGVYGSVLWGMYDNWYKVGGIWRISKPKDWVDWQLYGGMVVGVDYHAHWGGEFGLRYAVDNIYGNHRFSWWSTSLGVAIVEGTPFCTWGFSIGLSVLSLPTFLLF